MVAVDIERKRREMKIMNKFLMFIVATLGVVFACFIFFVLSTSTQRAFPSLPLKKELEHLNVLKQDIEVTEIDILNLHLKNNRFTLLNDEVNTTTVNKVIAEIREFSKKSNAPIYLLLDSPGGSVIDGARLIATITSSSAPVYTVCIQICASMAAMILEYGKERYAVDRSIIMFHPASMGGLFAGELDKIVSRLTFLQRYVDKMDVHTAKRAGMTYTEFKALTTRELWIDAEDALNKNIIDRIVHVDLDAKDIYDFSQNRMRDAVNLEY